MSDISPTHSGALYFGKIPARGDFVRSAGGSAITQGLDRWISAAMERISAQAEWKTNFDCAAPVDFAFCGPKSNNLLLGHLHSSRDSSGRRYPFVIAVASHIVDPAQTIALLPLVAAPAWERMHTLARDLVEAQDVSQALEHLDKAVLIPEGSELGEARSAFQRLLAHMNVGEIEQTMIESGNPVSLRTALLASGLLLLPLLSNAPSGQATQGLAFPLPSTTQASISSAALWMNLISPFFARSDLELGLLLSRLDQRPQLLLGLQGANPRLLESVLSPGEAFVHNIDMCQSDWVEDYVNSDYSLRKLSDYLAHPNLSLKQACATYAEVFLGA